jgi:hypothetical protein
VTDLAVRAGEQPSARGACPEDGEERGSHFARFDVLGLAGFADVGTAEAIHRHRVEGVRHLHAIEMIGH